MTNGTYHYVWDAAADLTAAADKVRHGAVKSYVATEKSDKVTGVQLWAGGPYWAECNLGAEKPEDTGDYFFWGDTNGCKRVGSSWVENVTSNTVQFSGSRCYTYGKSNQQLFDLGYTTNATSGVLKPEYDAATAKLGPAWRMPTKEELSALFSKCNHGFDTLNGVSGYKFTGKEAGYTDKWIFLPAAGCGDGSSLGSLGSYGYYWSSTAYAGDSYSVWGLYFYDDLDDCGVSGYEYGRSRGRSVRPVAGFAK